MNRLKLIAWCTTTIFPLSCNGQEGPNAAYTKAKAEYDALAKGMVQSVAYIGEPLKGLTDEQQASVAALLVMTRMATRTEGISATATPLEGFWVEVPGICPPMPGGLDKTFGDCFDQEIAYAQSMARCLDEGKSEAECERESAGDLSAAVICQMGQIEKMKGIIERIQGRKWPPGPFPWPEGGERPIGD